MYLLCRVHVIFKSHKWGNTLIVCIVGNFVFEMIDSYIISTAIATVVTIAEILKNNGLAVEKSEILAPIPLNLFL